MICQSFDRETGGTKHGACGVGDYPTQTYQGVGTDLHPKKVIIWPDGARSVSVTRGPPVVAVACTGHTTPAIVNYRYDIYIIRRVLLAAHAWDVTSSSGPRISGDHGTNDHVMVHGDGTRADGRRSEPGAHLSEIVGSRVGRAARSISWGLERRSTRQGRLSGPSPKKRLKRKLI